MREAPTPENEAQRQAALRSLGLLDALDDPRFADNPLVTGEPYIRFYATALDGGDTRIVKSRLRVIIAGAGDEVAE